MLGRGRIGGAGRPFGGLRDRRERVCEEVDCWVLPQVPPPPWLGLCKDDGAKSAFSPMGSLGAVAEDLKNFVRLSTCATIGI